MQNTDLYNTIVKHRSKFTSISGINYANHSPDKISIIPPDIILKDWERDYDIMKQAMIFDNPLSFDELIKRIAELQKRINESNNIRFLLNNMVNLQTSVTFANNLQLQ